MKLTKRKYVHFKLADIKSMIQQSQPPSPASASKTYFDLAEDPFSNKRLATSSPYAPSILSQPATRLPIRKLQIVIRPVPSVMFMVSVANSFYVSVGNLLQTLHQSLQVRVSEEDWAKLEMWEQHEIAKAFYDRCEASADYYGTLFNGVTYLDLLCGETAFQGIVPSKQWVNTWELVLRKRRSPAAPPHRPMPDR